MPANWPRLCGLYLSLRVSATFVRSNRTLVLSRSALGYVHAFLCQSSLVPEGREWRHRLAMDDDMSPLFGPPPDLWEESSAASLQFTGTGGKELLSYIAGGDLSGLVTNTVGDGSSFGGDTVTMDAFALNDRLAAVGGISVEDFSAVDQATLRAAAEASQAAATAAADAAPRLTRGRAGANDKVPNQESSQKSSSLSQLPAPEVTAAPVAAAKSSAPAIETTTRSKRSRSSAADSALPAAAAPPPTRRVRGGPIVSAQTTGTAYCNVPEGSKLIAEARASAAAAAADAAAEEDDDADGDDDDGGGDGTARSRARNRAHARKSRLRKKFFIDSLRADVLRLELENAQLRSIAGGGTAAAPARGAASSTRQVGPSLLASSATDVPRIVVKSEDWALLRLLSDSMQHFVVSDPTRPDNPIVFASQRFYDLTGYEPDEVLGRNCRFLQGPGTDRRAVLHIRRAILLGEEAAVTLLNYRKDGTPFFNALFIAPLRDSTGNIVNFVGVQRGLPANLAETVMADQAKAWAEADLQASHDDLTSDIGVRADSVSSDTAIVSGSRSAHVAR